MTDGRPITCFTRCIRTTPLAVFMRYRRTTREVQSWPVLLLLRQADALDGAGHLQRAEAQAVDAAARIAHRLQDVAAARSHLQAGVAQVQAVALIDNQWVHQGVGLAVLGLVCAGTARVIHGGRHAER